MLTAASPLRNVSTQTSKLLPSLFQCLEPEQPVTVFHVGPAVAETVDFFAGYRCKLHFIDVFAELPMQAGDDTPPLVQQFAELLRLPSDTRLDICLFWDVFNFLDRAAVSALLSVLQPHLKKTCVAHAFSVHNRKMPRVDYQYGLRDGQSFSCRDKRILPAGYAPHSQRELLDLLSCFTLERSVLLPDSRLELLLQAKL